MQFVLLKSGSWQNALSRRAVLKARRRCIEYLKRMRSVSTDFEALRCPRATEPPIRLLDKVDLHADANILQVLEDDNLFQIYQHIYCAGQGLEYEGTATLQYKWLRAVGTGLFTGIHTGTLMDLCSYKYIVVDVYQFSLQIACTWAVKPQA
jgi:hypothetical protein